MAIDSIGLNSISKINPLNTNSTNISKSDNVTSGFSDYLKSAIDNVQSLQDNATVAKQQLALGEIDDISSVMTAVEKADLALQFTLAIRNKIMDAYSEIMRMQV